MNGVFMSLCGQHVCCLHRKNITKDLLRGKVGKTGEYTDAKLFVCCVRPFPLVEGLKSWPMQFHLKWSSQKFPLQGDVPVSCRATVIFR